MPMIMEKKQITSLKTLGWFQCVVLLTEFLPFYKVTSLLLCVRVNATIHTVLILH